MLHKVLDFLKTQLKAAINSPEGQDSVVISSVVNEKGEPTVQSGQVSLTLVNIEEERFLKAQQPREKRNGDQVQYSNPEIKLNLLLMLAANPGVNNYTDALERLSGAITFFQGTSFFDRIKFPALDPAIEQLSVELFSLSLEQQNQLWASLGAKYLPSVVYKVRLVVIDKSLYGDNKPVVKVIDTDLKKIA